MNSRQDDQKVFDLSFVLYVKKIVRIYSSVSFFLFIFTIVLRRRLEIEVSRSAVFCRERGSVNEFIKY